MRRPWGGGRRRAGRTGVAPPHPPERLRAQAAGVAGVLMGKNRGLKSPDPNMTESTTLGAAQERG